MPFHELLQFELSPETLARDTFLLNAASVSALTWVVYDMILNFNREINLVWNRWHEPKGRRSRRLYVIVRYFSVVALALFVGVNTSVGLSLDFCRVWYYIVLVNTTIITLLPDVMLLIRLNAVYSWNFRTLLLTIFLFMIQTTTSLVAGVLAVSSAQFPSQTHPFPVSGCPIVLSTSVARFTLVAWIPSVLAQATYLGLMLSTLAHLIRSLDVGGPPSPPRPSNNETPSSLRVPVPAVVRSRERPSLPSSPISKMPSPLRSHRPRVLTSAPPRLSSLPLLRLPQPSPLASTSGTSSVSKNHPTLQDSTRTLVSNSASPAQHDSAINPNSNVYYASNVSTASNTGVSAGGRKRRMKAGGARLGGAGELPVPSADVPSTSRIPDSSNTPRQGATSGDNALEMQMQDHSSPKLQRTRTTSIQARDGIERPLYEEEHKTWSKGAWHGTGSWWKQYRSYTPSLFSLFSWKALKQVQRLVPTMMVFVGHGSWYFGLGILAKVVNAIMVTTYRGPLQAFAIPCMMALYPVLVSRIYLSMVHYLHFGLPMKNPRLLASYEGENYASGYRGDTSTYGMDDDDDDLIDDLVVGGVDQGRYTREDPEEVWEVENEGRIMPRKLRFSIGGTRLKTATESSSGRGRGQGRGTSTRGRGYDEPGRGHKPRGPRLGRITFAARESLANSSVLDLGFGNEEF